MSSRCAGTRTQSVNASGPGLLIEGYRGSCSCGWRTDLFPTRPEAADAVTDHLASDVCVDCLHGAQAHTYESGCDWCSCPATLGAGRQS